MTGLETANTVRLNDDMGVFLTHPEIVQEHPSASIEWLENHKKLIMAALGGAACLAAGTLAGRRVFAAA